MSAILTAIAARCCAPEWATFFEVSSAAGFGAARRADAVAMNTWPSRGLAVHGFEVKVSRADWLRELRDPAKSEPIQRYCDRWWICVDDDAIVTDEELPETWGLLVLRKGKLVQRRAAPALPAVPLSRDFVAGLLRRATENSTPNVSVEALVEQRLEARVLQRQSQERYDLKSLELQLATLKKAVADFEAASGVRVSADRWNYTWTPENVGAALKVLVSTQRAASVGTLEQARNLAAAFAREASDAVDALKAIHAGAGETGGGT